MSWRVPFNRPAAVGREAEYLAQAVASGHDASDGPGSASSRGTLLQDELDSARVLLTTSCAHALARLWQGYVEDLGEWVAACGPVPPSGCDHTDHLFYPLLPSEATRAALIQ